MAEPRRAGEKTCDYLGRFAGELANAALVARERGDDVHALFFAMKAAEVLKLAKHLGFKPSPSPRHGEGGGNG